MKRLIPALLLAAAIPAFAADAPTDDTVVETHAVATPDSFPFTIEAQILPENGYRLKITDKTTGKVQITQEEVAPSSVGGLKLTDVAGRLADVSQDFNGDGHPDIAVPISGAYTTTADELYLFHPATRRFEPVPDGKGFAYVGDVKVIRKGCVRVEYKSSIMDYDEEDYCWKNGGWEMLRLKNTKPHKKPKGK
jgi:hypothetical protein